jgi:hypothetical protein
MSADFSNSGDSKPAHGGHETPKWDAEPERWAKERARYIRRTTDFDSTEAEIIAFAELGYSHSGIGKRVDVTESTVVAKFDEIDDVDPTALLSRRPSELGRERPVGVTGTNAGGSA